MANTATLKSTTIPNLPTFTNPQPTDWVIVEHTEPSANGSVTGKISIQDIARYTGILSIPITNVTPSSSSTTSIKGNTWSDGNYLYVTTDTNVVKRVALSSF